MAIAETLAGLKALSTGLKSLGQIADTIKNAEVKQITSDMLDKVIALQHDLLGMQQENADLKDQVRSLKDKAAAKANLVFEKNAMWKVTASGKQGPYCSNCNTKGLESPLHSGEWTGLSVNYQCPTCDKYFEVG